MTEDERELLVQVAKYLYAKGMCAVVSGEPMLLAIRKFDPEFQLTPYENNPPKIPRDWVNIKQKAQQTWHS